MIILFAAGFAEPRFWLDAQRLTIPQSAKEDSQRLGAALHPEISVVVRVVKRILLLLLRIKELMACYALLTIV